MSDRYDRQTMLPEIGAEGQRRLRRARILIVGIGGLGCPAALYLAGAGVGTLGLVDDDRVSTSNLQRQVLYTEAEVGQPKVTCAARRLRALNSEVRTEEHPHRLTPDNAHEIIGRYDMVIDGCDNPATRYLLSDTCAALHIPYIYGAITPFSGQVAVLCSHDGSRTYRDLFPCEESVPTHTERNGVIGPTPAIIGNLQAAEAMKLICGFGSPLTDKLWTIDLLTLQTFIISI